VTTNVNAGSMPWFAAVKQCGSYTRATPLLGVSQSTVTRWMQKASPMITTGAAMR
jgi:DNA-binding transcriptional LysR family regulator